MIMVDGGEGRKEGRKEKREERWDEARTKATGLMGEGREQEQSE